jgi:hypothetical protein
MYSPARAGLRAFRRFPAELFLLQMYLSRLSGFTGAREARPRVCF